MTARRTAGATCLIACVLVAGVLGGEVGASVGVTQVELLEAVVVRVRIDAGNARVTVPDCADRPNTPTRAVPVCHLARSCHEQRLKGAAAQPT